MFDLRRMMLLSDLADLATGGSVSGQIAVAAFNMGISLLAVPTMRHFRVAEPDLRIQVSSHPARPPSGCSSRTPGPGRSWPASPSGSPGGATSTSRPPT